MPGRIRALAMPKEGTLSDAIESLYAELRSRGLHSRVVPIAHLSELQQDILGRKADGQFDDVFYGERLSAFTFAPPDDFPDARSLIVVAVPRPQTRLRFTWHGTTRALVLPPTYLGYNRIFRETEALLNDLLAASGYHAAQARLPLKLLTVRCGLAEYGRNNVTYIAGLGSFFQATAFYSDLPCEQDTWREARMLARCASCKACMIKCPTNAITADRFLIHAERCLVFHNERAAEVVFPSWIDPRAHNCLIGCMLCQRFCPEDKPFLRWFDGNEDFSHEETSLLLQGVAREQLPLETYRKLERLELLDDVAKLPRNLAVFFTPERSDP